jgi:hypothetical protein
MRCIASALYRLGVFGLGVADGYLHPVFPRDLADADNLAQCETEEKDSPPTRRGLSVGDEAPPRLYVARGSCCGAASLISCSMSLMPVLART